MNPIAKPAAGPGATTGPKALEKKHTVTLIPGDGIGEEIADQVVRIVQATGVSLGWDRQLSGHKAQAKTGSALPPALLDSIRTHKVALKGRINTPIGTGYESPNVQLRKILNLYASVRPVKNIAGLRARFDKIDLVVVRENTEDMYSGIEHEVVPGVVESLKIVTEAASTRIARFAFEYAVKYGRRQVACVHKANIMKMSDGLFLTCCRNVAREFPQIAYREVIADSACMQLVLNPYAFDVMVMGNLYGDIISDLCAGLVGGLGAVPGVNVGDGLVVFEAIHGNAPELEGQDLANPLSLLIPAVHMLDHLGESDAAARLMSAVSAVLVEGKALTADLGGTAKLSEMAAAIIAKLPAAGRS
ncbi:MAG TPA: isocitrate/isopropylmalate family dehydrogenase [Verrucomicrobiae bacterium]|nr:isocitrate/isopropylmalate family dehydrogenase [Verrucomicrobiae bacterium]